MEVHVEQEHTHQYSTGQNEGLRTTQCVCNERDKSANCVGKGKNCAQPALVGQR